MGEVSIRYPDKWVATGGRSREEVESDLRFQLAVRLFEIGRLSVGKAAELAGGSGDDDGHVLLLGAGGPDGRVRGW